MQTIKIGLVIPYFGKLPKTFNSWLKSAENNTLIDFHLITDQTIDCNLPLNIYLHNMSYEDLCDLVKQKLQTNLKTPYKLCDLKPTYGFLFDDILRDYDFWGYSDLDLVYGDLRTFVENKGIFEVYDKIFDLGHLSFYRNQKIINKIFNACVNNYSYWDYIKKSEIIWVFDENHYGGMIGVNGILKSYDFKVLSGHNYFSDISPKYTGFIDVKDKNKANSFFKLKAGKLTRNFLLENKVQEEEVFYAHYQKREVKEIIISDKEFLIVPNTWGECSSFDTAVSFLYSHQNNDLNVNYNYKRWEHKRARKKVILFIKDLCRYLAASRYLMLRLKRLLLG